MEPNERSMQMRLASHLSWANTPDRRARTEKARHASHVERFEKQVDPDGTMPPEERRLRAESAKKAYYTELALKSAQVRRIRKAEADKAKARKVAGQLATRRSPKGSAGPSAA